MCQSIHGCTAVITAHKLTAKASIRSSTPQNMAADKPQTHLGHDMNAVHQLLFGVGGVTQVTQVSPSIEPEGKPEQHTRQTAGQDMR